MSFSVFANTSSRYAVLILALVPAFVWSAERVVGANQTLNLDPAAHAAGSGGANMAFPGTALESGVNPVGMLDIPSHAAGISHTLQYEDTYLDGLALVYAVDSATRAAFLFSRFSASGIPYYPEGAPLPQSDSYETFSIADYSLSLLAAHTFRWHVDVAMSMHFMYRELDQTGFGFRGDAALRWRPVDFWFISSKLEGWTSSAARWESGQVEYSPAELRLATGFAIPASYLYGTVRIGYQSAGVLHHGNRWLSVSNAILGDTLAESGSAVNLGGDRAWESPWEWFQDGSAGLELDWDWGGAVRGGWQSLRDFDSWTLGAGIEYHRWLKVEYAFQRHPELSSIHRVSLELKPWWHQKILEKKMQSSSEPLPLETEAVPDADSSSTEELEIIEEESSGKSWEE